MCNGEYRKSQILFIFDGIFVNAAVVLTMGVFLSGYIIHLKGSDFLVGLLNNSLAWTSVVAIFSFFIYERMERRKKFLITMNIASRILVCSTVFLPLISSNNNFLLNTVTIMVIVGSILWGVYSIGSTVWLISILSPQSRNEYINVRVLYLRISFTVFTIVMGFVLDWFHKSYTGFLIVFTTSLLLSIIDVLVLINIKEKVCSVDKEAKFNLSNFFAPVKDKLYRTFLLFIFFFYLCLTMSSSFTPLYLIRYLKFDYKLITVINVIMYVIMIMCTRFWGRVERKRNLNFVFKVTPLFLIGEFLIYSFLKNDTYFLLFISPIFAGIGSSGFNIAIFSYRYEIIPENSRMIYEGWFGAAFGLSMLAAPVLGNALMKQLPTIHNAVYQYSSFQLLYLISFATAGVVVWLMFYRPHKIQKREGNFV